MHGVDPAGPFHSSPRVCWLWVADTPGPSPKGQVEREGRGREEGGAQARLPLVTGPAPRTLRQHKPISSPHFRSHCMKGQSGSNLLTSRSEPQVPSSPLPAYSLTDPLRQELGPSPDRDKDGAAA